MTPSPSPASDLLKAVTIDYTVGPMLIGMAMSAVLFGTSNLQVYIYYHEFPKDLMVFRISVAIIWMVDAVQLLMAIHVVYYYLVSNFGVYNALAAVVWSFKMTVITNVIVVDYVQILYAYRLWRFNYGRRLFSYLVPVIVVAGVGVGIVISIKVYNLHVFSDFNSMAWAVYLTLSYVTVVDSAIAGTMCYYLRRSRMDVRFTGTIISKLLLWTVGTGLITSVCALAALIAYAAMPQNLVFIGIEMLLAKLYFNSILAMLNARRSMRKALDSGKETPDEVLSSIINLPAHHQMSSPSTPGDVSGLILPSLPSEFPKRTAPLVGVVDAESGIMMGSSMTPLR